MYSWRRSRRALAHSSGVTGLSINPFSSRPPLQPPRVPVDHVAGVRDEVVREHPGLAILLAADDRLGVLPKPGAVPRHQHFRHLLAPAADRAADLVRLYQD